MKKMYLQTNQNEIEKQNGKWEITKRKFKSVRREHAKQQNEHGETERVDKLERLRNVPEPL